MCWLLHGIGTKILSDTDTDTDTHIHTHHLHNVRRKQNGNFTEKCNVKDLRKSDSVTLNTNTYSHTARVIYVGLWTYTAAQAHYESRIPMVYGIFIWFLLLRSCTSGYEWSRSEKNQCNCQVCAV